MSRSTKGGGIFPLQGRPPAGSQPAAPHAQQREGEYSPSKLHPDWRPRRRELRSTKGGGIFPLQGPGNRGVDCGAFDRSTKGGGIFPLQVATVGPRRGCVMTAQQREGEYSPSKAHSPTVRSRRVRRAQQREGEYSPSKWAELFISFSAPQRSTKGGGIFPLQGGDARYGRADPGATLNKGRGNIPPPSPPVPVLALFDFGAQQREGEYSPSKVSDLSDVGHSGGRSTKGGGIFPLQVDSITADDLCLNAQQREGEYSPSKDRHRAGLDRSDLRSTKGGGIFPLQDDLVLAVKGVRRRSTKGGGIFPLQGCQADRALPTRPIAQQREGEYSPSKRRSAAGDCGCGPSLNKGRGNIPPPR